MPAKKFNDAPCPCGNPRSYATCCSQYHAGCVAPTAEDLMRSRYSAYVLSLEPYLLATWHASTRPQSLGLDSDEPANQKTRWLGLEIKRHQPTGTDSAIVEFVARYKTAGRAHRMHESSRFLRENGRWYYLDGEFKDAP
ncbi:MAG: YchJ family protein [Propionivibrio sp.]